MHVLEAQEGAVVYIGNLPVAVEYARAKTVRLITVTAIEESEEDLRRFLAKRRREIVDYRRSKRHNDGD